MSSYLTHSKNALIVLLSSLLSIGIGLVFVWSIDVTLPKIFINQFMVQPANYSIAISNLQNPEDFYKISPFDDAIVYSDGTKRKILPADNTLTNDFVWREILREPQVKFTQLKNPDGLQIVYEITKNQSLDVILVNKQIRNLPQKATGFVDTFGFTQEDFVIDSEGTLYTRQGEITLLQKILKLRQNVHLQNINKDRIEINGISFLEIVNPSATGKIIIRVQPRQKIILDLNYRLIEVETLFDAAQSEINHQQIIYFQI